jgi:nuclear pore complex protein Nup155
MAAGSSAPRDLETLNQSQAAPEPPLPPILKAARSVNQVLQADESFPDLDSYCRREYQPFV